MNKEQLTKLDDLRDRLLQEYTMNGETDDYKKIMKKVIEIGTRIVHSTLTDISDIPKISFNFERILEQMESIKVGVKAVENKVDLLETKVDERLNHNTMSDQCKLQTEKLIYNILNVEHEKTKKNVSFGMEIIRFFIYVTPVVAAIVWVSAHAGTHLVS